MLGKHTTTELHSQPSLFYYLTQLSMKYTVMFLFSDGENEAQKGKVQVEGPEFKPQYHQKKKGKQP
jgi:hypothetical protein